MKSLSWLHVSDWHERGSDFDRTVVLDALIDDIERRATFSSNKLRDLDFVFFTGDLAFSGTQAEYARAATEFVERLRKGAGIEKERFFFVPGNHDLDRTELKALPSLLTTFTALSELGTWLETEKRKEALLGPMAAFRAFSKEFYKGVPGREDLDPSWGYLKEIDIRGTSVAILGLNSAWMCGQRIDGKEVNDYGYLILGEPQFSRHIPPKARRADIRIALMHHPFCWFGFLEPPARTKTRLLDNCDFILRGHEHEATVEVPSGDVGRCAVISAGAAYDRRDYPNGYNFVHLDLEQRQGIIYLRRFESNKSRFMADISLSPDTPGYLTFTLPQQGYQKSAGLAGTAQTLSGERAVERAPAPLTDAIATTSLSGDSWSTENQSTMRKLFEIYRIHHAQRKFRQRFSSFAVQANCLLPEGDPAYGSPDVIETVKELQADGSPIYCLLVTLTVSTKEDFAGAASWKVRFLDGKPVSTIAIPVSGNPGTRQLLLFFNPPAEPAGSPIVVELEWRVQNSLPGLVKSGKDELFINPMRATGAIERMDLVLKVPVAFGELQMVPSRRERASGAGQLMTERELADYGSPPGFKTIGWTGRDLDPEKLFGVELSAVRGERTGVARTMAGI